MPKFIQLGTNDPYWAVNSSTHYFQDLPKLRYMFQEANARHHLGKRSDDALIAWLKYLATGTSIPEISWSRKGNVIIAQCSKRPLELYRWSACEPESEFKTAKWDMEMIDPSNFESRVELKLPHVEGKHCASFFEMKFSADLPPLTLTTDVFITEPIS